MTRVRLFGTSAMFLLCAGCSRAPSISIIGSFFPVWMLCLLLGVILTFAVRYLLVRYHLEAEVGAPAFFYPCVITLFACLLWLIFFR
jgi:hypothetical protein